MITIEIYVYEEEGHWDMYVDESLNESQFGTQSLIHTDAGKTCPILFVTKTTHAHAHELTKPNSNSASLVSILELSSKSGPKIPSYQPISSSPQVSSYF